MDHWLVGVHHILHSKTAAIPLHSSSVRQHLLQSAQVDEVDGKDEIFVRRG